MTLEEPEVLVNKLNSLNILHSVSYKIDFPSVSFSFKAGLYIVRKQGICVPEERHLR